MPVRVLPVGLEVKVRKPSSLANNTLEYVGQTAIVIYSSNIGHDGSMATIRFDNGKSFDFDLCELEYDFNETLITLVAGPKKGMTYRFGNRKRLA